MDVRQFARRHRISIDKVVERGIDKSKDGWEHRKYEVTLRIKPREDPDRLLAVPWMQGMGIVGDPTVDMVLDSIASDASAYDNAQDFEDFANEFGYDTDSIWARDTYLACGEMKKKLTVFLGDDRLVEQAMYQMERL